MYSEQQQKSYTEYSGCVNSCKFITRLGLATVCSFQMFFSKNTAFCMMICICLNFEGERTVIVSECLWFGEKIKFYQILLFSSKSSLVFSILW